MRTALVCCAIAIASVGCDKLMKKKDAGSDTGTTTTSSDVDSSTTTSADDAGAPQDAAAAVTATNEAQIKHFDDEEKLEHDEYSIEWPTVDAKTEPGTGTTVATLSKGTKATFQSRKGRSVLAMFADPKDSTKFLLGWFSEDAFVPGTAPPPPAIKINKDGGVAAGTKTTGVCPAGLTLLFGEDAFCGKTCKTDKDCTAGLVCQGQAKPITAGGMGAPVTVCAKPLPRAGSTPDAGAAKTDAGTPATTTKPDAGTTPATSATDAGAATPKPDAGTTSVGAATGTSAPVRTVR